MNRGMVRMTLWAVLLTFSSASCVPLPKVRLEPRTMLPPYVRRQQLQIERLDALKTLLKELAADQAASEKTQAVARLALAAIEKEQEIILAQQQTAERDQDALAASIDIINAERVAFNSMIAALQIAKKRGDWAVISQIIVVIAGLALSRL